MAGDMGKKHFRKLLVWCLPLFLTGCGQSEASEAETETEEIREMQTEADADEATDSAEELLDAFLAGEIPAFYMDSGDTLLMSDLPFDAEDWYSYTVGERIDLDNDGEPEQIVDGPYGGIYLDARDTGVYVLAAGDGTAVSLSYTNFDGAFWIVYSDTMHGGRQVYRFIRYDGGGSIADEFELNVEYGESAGYDENSVFTYRGEEISMTEYEALKEQLLGD